jgi:DNA-binding transcriptional MocR family regulator
VEVFLMSYFQSMDIRQLQAFQAEYRQKYEGLKARKLKLNMSRGVPGPDQLDLSNGMLTCVSGNDYKTVNGIDSRNYGGVEGLAETRSLFGAMLDVSPDRVIVGCNSSLALMYDLITRALLLGVPGGDAPWGKTPVKFICPSPGYDRHFAICQLLNIEMLTVAMEADGPDMDQVERLVADDASVKGIWCVPRYSNPTGITYSDAVVDRFARMKTKAKDFRIIWDNAYAVHHLTETPDRLKNILEACVAAGNPDRVFVFGSTSKISFAGAGLGFVASSATNIDWLKRMMIIQTIGPDKVNQLRHVRFFKDFAGIEAHMRKHAKLLKPKFDKVDQVLNRELGDKGIASWTKPKGGYFISLDIMEGCAKKVVAMAAEAGVTLTPAGATFPYGKDPKDRNIRIAPTFPPVEELATAIEILAVCIQLAAVEKMLNN